MKPFQDLFFRESIKLNRILICTWQDKTNQRIIFPFQEQQHNIHYFQPFTLSYIYFLYTDTVWLSTPCINNGWLYSTTKFDCLFNPIVKDEKEIERQIFLRGSKKEERILWRSLRDSLCLSMMSMSPVTAEEKSRKSMMIWISNGTKCVDCRSFETNQCWDWLNMNSWSVKIVGTSLYSSRSLLNGN